MYYKTAACRLYRKLGSGFFRQWRYNKLPPSRRLAFLPTDTNPPVRHSLRRQWNNRRGLTKLMPIGGGLVGVLFFCLGVK